MSQQVKQMLLFIGDLLILFVSLFITTLVYKQGYYHHEFFIRHVEAFSFIFPVWFVTYYIEGIYSLRTFNKDGLIISLVRAQGLNTIISFIFFYLFAFSGLSPRTNILLIAGISGLLLFIFRKIFFTIFSSQGMSIKTVAIGGAEHIAEIEEHLRMKPYLGFQIIQKSQTTLPEFPANTGMIAVDRTQFGNKELLNILTAKLSDGVQLIEMSRFSELVTGKIPVSAIDESWFIENCAGLSNRGYTFLKALLDRSVAITLFIIIIPIYALLLPLLLLISGRPLFYSQIRTGLNNKPFRIYKLRTMTTDAEKGKALWAQPGDTRVTPIGKFLRKTRLDELPQLWNILNGDMSLVGPRPERPEIIKEQLEKTIPFYNFRHLVKPGVTGWAQINFRYGYSQEDSLRKLQYDLYYVKNKSIWLDIKIILKTIKTVLTGMGQ